ncbi:MAG: ABC transporter substrate-binding protein, partial [Rhodospirillales bacterium]
MTKIARALVLLVAVLAAGFPGRGTAAEKEKKKEFLETPSFLVLVGTGVLPPVEQRIPKTPSIVTLDGAQQSYGHNGGALRIVMAKARDSRMMTVYGYARLVAYDRNLRLVPDILERIEVREGRRFTLHLRKGHRWSDGHPFTAEDFRYYWEDIARNPKLSPLGPHKRMLVDNLLPTFEVLDETTVRYTWSRPNPYFLTSMANAAPLFIYRPAHYLKQFHEKYADAETLKKVAGEARHMDWAALHQAKDQMYLLDNPDMPTLQPWVPTTWPPSERFIFRRNPFYHRVDAKGHQLPYIDEIIMNISLGNLIPAKTGAGESDLQGRYIAFEDYTFLKENEKQHDFSVRLWSTVKGAQIAIYPNLNTADPIWRKVLRDVRFRRALSLAINRREINEVVYFGLAKAGNNTVLETSPLFKPEYRRTWATFDLATANRLLDEMGLDKRDGNGIRLLPNGEPAIVIVDTSGERTETTDVLELIRDTWLKAGIKLLTRPAQRDIFRNRVFSGQSMMSVWSGLANGIP